MADPIHASWRAVVLALGILFLAAGLFWPLFSRYLGRLPGDIVVRREGWTVFFPIVTCIVLSFLISLLLWIFRR
jgi:hypothetical protein